MGTKNGVTKGHEKLFLGCAKRFDGTELTTTADAGEKLIVVGVVVFSSHEDTANTATRTRRSADTARGERRL
jgi:hypothetical protein